MRTCVLITWQLLLLCTCNVAGYALFPTKGGLETPVSMCHDVAGWRVTFEDHFNGDSINKSNWIVRDNMTHGDPTQEQELYVASAVSVANGHLILTTRKEEVIGPSGTMYNFTSGWVRA